MPIFFMGELMENMSYTWLCCIGPLTALGTGVWGSDLECDPEK